MICQVHRNRLREAYHQVVVKLQDLVNRQAVVECLGAVIRK